MTRASPHDQRVAVGEVQRATCPSVCPGVSMIHWLPGTSARDTSGCVSAIHLPSPHRRADHPTERCESAGCTATKPKRFVCGRYEYGEPPGRGRPGARRRACPTRGASCGGADVVEVPVREEQRLDPSGRGTRGRGRRSSRCGHAAGTPASTTSSGGRPSRRGTCWCCDLEAVGSPRRVPEEHGCTVDRGRSVRCRDPLVGTKHGPWTASPTGARERADPRTPDDSVSEIRRRSDVPARTRLALAKARQRWHRDPTPLIAMGSPAAPASRRSSSAPASGGPTPGTSTVRGVDRVHRAPPFGARGELDADQARGGRKGRKARARRPRSRSNATGCTRTA